MTSYTWNVDADGNWATDQNWGQTGAPEAGGDVTINTTDFHTINFGNNGGAATVDTLTVGNDLLVLADGSLTINKTASFASGLTFGGGVLDMAAGSKVTVAGGLGGGGYGVIAGTGTMTVTGTADLSSLTQTDFNTVILQNASKIDGGYTLQDGAFLENQNSLSLIGGRLTFGQGTIQNDATGQIDIVSDFQFFNAGSTNSFLNYGTIDRYVTSGIAEIQAPTYNTGTIEIDTGTLNFDGGGTFEGTLPATNFDDTIGGAGTLELGGGNWTIDSGTIFNVANWTIDGGSTVTLAENTTYAGNFTLAQGASLNVVQGLTLTLTGKVDIQGAVTGTGTVAVAGTTSLANNETVTGGQLATTSTGTIQVTAGTSTIDASTTTFNNPGSFVVGLSTSVGLEGTIDNQGKITVAGADNNATTNLVIHADVTLTGNGKLVLTDSNTNQIYTDTPNVTLNNVNNTINGAGQFGAGTQLTVLNGGTIDADDDEPLNINLGGNTLTNSSNGVAGFLEATGTGGLTINNTVVVGGTIQAVGAGSHVDFNSITVVGATLTETNGGLIQANNSTLDGSTNTVTINGGLTVELSNLVNLRGTINNKGTISLVGQDNNATTNLVIDSALVTLTGNGSIVLSDSGTNQIYTSAGNNVLDNTAGSTISGAGQIGAGTQLALNNEGTIDANQTEALTINLGGNTLTNTGLLEGAGAGGLVIYNSVVEGGTLVDTGAGGLGINGATVDGATIQSLVAGSLIDLSSATITGSTLITSVNGMIQTTGGSSTIDSTKGVFNNAGSLTVGLSTNLSLLGTVNNTGTITLAGQDNNATTNLIVASDTVTLTGHGKLVLSDSGTNQIYTAEPNNVLDNADNTISGAGQIGAGTQLTLNNGGTIDADQDEAISINLGANTLTNTGTLEDTGTGGLSIYNTTVAGGTIQAMGGGAHVDISTVTIVGATLSAADGGLIQANATTLDGSTTAVTINGGLTVELSTVVNLRGTIVNHGTISLVGQDNNATTNLVIDSALVTLTGNGSIVLSDSGTNQIYAGTGNNVLDNTAGSTISGAGQIGAGTQLTLNNEGTIDANQSESLTINLGGNTLTNTSTIEDTSTGGLVIYTTTVEGGTLVDSGTGGLTINSTTVDGATIQSLVAGSHIDLSSATITDSTLTTSANGVLQTTGGSSTIDSTEGVFNNAGQLTIGLSSNLTLLGAVNNTGTIMIAGQDNNATTNLIVGSDIVTLMGQGKLVLSDSGTNQIYTAVPNNALDNVDNTISGAGQIGVGTQLTLINSGTINADQDQALTINLGGNTLTNTGTLEATGTAGLVINTTTVVGGTIQALVNGSNIFIDSGTIAGATLGTANGGLILTNGSVLDGSTNAVNITGDGLTVALSTQLALRGTINNSGALNLAGADNNATTNLIIDSATVTLTGGGSLVLTDSTTNQIYGSASTDVLDNTAGNTIVGAGALGVGMLTLANEGTINASQTEALTINTGANAVTNTGTVEDTGAGGLIIDSTVNGGTIQALAAGSHIDLSGGTIGAGAVLATANGGIIQTAGTGSLDGTGGAVNNNGDVLVNLTNTLNLLGAIDNTGTIMLAGADNTAATSLVINAPMVTLTGKGSIVLSNSATNEIYGASATDVLDNADNTISGSGQIGAAQLTLTNAGTIDANQSEALTINTGDNAVTNTGTIEDTGIGGLIIQSTVNGGAIQALVADSHIDLNGGTIGAGATLATANGGVVQTVGTASLDGIARAVNNTGAVLVNTGTTLNLSGAINNTGTVSLAGQDFSQVTNLVIASPMVTLTGGGSVLLSNSATDQIISASPDVVLDNVDNTISGAGQLGGAGQLTLINGGTIDADQSEPLAIDLSANMLTNTGTLEDTGTGGLLIDNATVSGGTIQALVAGSHVDLINNTIAGATLKTANGGVIQTIGTSTLDGTASAVNNTGAVLVNGATSLALLGTIKNSGTITVDGTVEEMGNVVLSAGSLVNQADGTWNAMGGFGIFLATGKAGTLTNAGAFAKEEDSGTATVGVNFADTGTVAVLGGKLSITGATNSFAGDISGAGTIEFGAASHSAINAGTTIETTGWTIDSATAAVTLNTSLSYNGAFALQSGGTMTIATGKIFTLIGMPTFNGAMVNGAGTLVTSGTAATTGALTIGGTVTWQNSGTAALTGSLTLGDNSKNKVVFTNGTKGTVNIIGANGINLGGASTSVFQNMGVLGKTGSAATSHIKVDVVDTGTITVTQGTLEFDGAINSFAGKINGAGTVAFGGGVSTMNAGIGGGISNVLIANKGTQIVVNTAINLLGNVTQQVGTTVMLGNSALGVGSAGSTATLAGTVSGTGTASALGFLGGTVTLNAGFNLLTKNWGIGNGVKVIDHITGDYDGTVAVGASSLTQTNTVLTLTGAVTFIGSTLDGGSLRSLGTTKVQGLTLGGGFQWMNSRTVTETAGVIVGDAAGKTATINNEAKAFYNLTAADAGIALAKGASGSLINAGTLQKNGGGGTSTVALDIVNSNSVIVSNGKLDLSGVITGTGGMNILKSATLELDGTVAKTQTITFAGGGDLDLTHAATFAGLVKGFSGATDVIDLAGFGTSAKTSFKENARKNGGTLTVTQGTLKASIALFGQYVAAGFKEVTDHAGGIDLTYIPPKPAHSDLAPHH